MLGSIDASALDAEITLSHRVLTRNTQGEMVASWPKPYARIWASKDDARGMKRFQAQTFAENLISEFKIRWRTDVVSTDRINVLRTKQVFEITQISEIPRAVGLDLLCRAIIE